MRNPITGEGDLERVGIEDNFFALGPFAAGDASDQPDPLDAGHGYGLRMSVSVARRHNFEAWRASRCAVVLHITSASLTLAAMYFSRVFTPAGGLLSYGASLVDAAHQGGLTDGPSPFQWPFKYGRATSIKSSMV
jgi:hypothetical protein